MDVTLNLELLWNAVVVLGILVSAAVYLRRLNQKAYIAAVRETSEGWKAAHDLKVTELTELRARVDELEESYRRQQEEYQQVLQLNLALQRDLRERDARIAELQKQVAALEGQVAAMMGARAREF